MVNLINQLPPAAYRHAIVSLTDVDRNFAARLQRSDVELISLHKPPGHGYKLYPRLYRLFRDLRPAIVHTRNLAALESMLPAWAAGVPVRIHGEHGWDMSDPGGFNRAMQWVRRAYRPFVGHYVAVSKALEQYLGRLGVPPQRVTQIYNGVDVQRFWFSAAREHIPKCPFQGRDEWLVGTVGRLQPIKDQLNLVRAFIRAVELAPSRKERLRLAIIGDGPLYTEASSLLKRAGLEGLAWMPGERDDVPAILRGLDCFVLPSLAEGISNTILEAMATGLPVIATDVGGNSELVEVGRTGDLVPASDTEALAHRILAYARDPAAGRSQGREGRTKVERQFSLESMVQQYHSLYDRMLQRHIIGAASPTPPGALDPGK
jgi:sugar transferase (PEP-CTERM/EpsH1 system associated)